MPPQKVTHERKASISLKGEKGVYNNKDKGNNDKKINSNQISISLSNSPNKANKNNLYAFSKPGSPNKISQNQKLIYNYSKNSFMKSTENSNSKKIIEVKKISPQRSASKNLINFSGKKQ